MKGRVVGEKQKDGEEDGRYEKDRPMRYQRNHRRKYSKETAGGANQKVTVATLCDHPIGNPSAAKCSCRAAYQADTAEDQARVRVAHMLVAYQHDDRPGGKGPERKCERSVTRRRYQPVPGRENLNRSAPPGQPRSVRFVVL